MNVLVLNSGSSSLKFQLIATDMDRIAQNADERLLRGEVARIGGEAIITLRKSDAAQQTLTAPIRDVSAALDFVLRWIVSDKSGLEQVHGPGDVHAVGHRVGHGGERFTASAVITDE